MKVQFIVATRASLEDFYLKTATGKSLALYQSSDLSVHVFPENGASLSTIYNSAIERFANEQCILVFAHDDIHITDFYWMHSVFNGLQHFGVVGCAGNVSRVPFQPSWGFKNLDFEWDFPQNLSGIVGQGVQFPPRELSIFGPPYRQVKLLDGLFLAAFSDTLKKSNLRFDERFDFHFYDMDFCRQAELLGVSMGTIPLSLVHESGGGYSSESWMQAYKKYIEKWGD
jgi:GT2 family glycosyltransferase